MKIHKKYIMKEKQIEIDFTSEDPKVARQPGIRWAPRDATPEEHKHWIDTDGKFWVEMNSKLVIIMSFVQVGMVALMLATFKIIDTFVNGPSPY